MYLLLLQTLAVLITKPNPKQQYKQQATLSALTAEQLLWRAEIFLKSFLDKHKNVSQGKV